MKSTASEPGLSFRNTYPLDSAIQLLNNRGLEYIGI